VRVRQKEIRTNLLIFHDSSFDSSRIAGGAGGPAMISGIGKVPGGKHNGAEESIYVHVTFLCQDPVGGYVAFEHFDRLAVIHMDEFRADDPLEFRDQPLLDALVEEGEIFLSFVQQRRDGVFQ
jgi:hypothetical protein